MTGSSTCDARRSAVAFVMAAGLLASAVPSAGAEEPAGNFTTAPAFSSGGQAAAVFAGGSIDQLQAAARGVGASGVWVQDRTGEFHLLVIGGPAFLTNAFAARFAASPAGPVPVMLIRPAATPAPATPPSIVPPRVFLLEPATLAATKARLRDRDPSLADARARLVRDADRALRVGPFSVTEKSAPPPSGDLHDYMSQSPYYWPNPATPDGLPYVYRDGEVNPERTRIPDDRNLGSMISATQTLALAYYFTDDARYAEHAALLMRTWFVDERTRMNPNLNFAQYVPGKNTGTPSGIIDTWRLPDVLDAIGMLGDSPALTTEDRARLRGWFAAYAGWLTASKAGRDEARATNNHGTFYDAQIAAIALYLGDDARARTVLQEARVRRIAAQIEPDGRQPLELRRTKAWSYSVFNLDALFRLAGLGDRAGVDLWTWESADGQGIRQALDWLVPYAIGERAWSEPQVTPFVPGELHPLLRRAAVAYRSPAYGEAARRTAPTNPTQDRLNLTIPYPQP